MDLPSQQHENNNINNLTVNNNVKENWFEEKYFPKKLSLLKNHFFFESTLKDIFIGSKLEKY